MNSSKKQNTSSEKINLKNDENQIVIIPNQSNLLNEPPSTPIPSPKSSHSLKLNRTDSEPPQQSQIPTPTPNQIYLIKLKESITHSQAQLRKLVMTATTTNSTAEQLQQQSYSNSNITFVDTITTFNNNAQKLLSSKANPLQISQALVYLAEAERILEYAAACGKSIHKQLILCVLHNLACVYQISWDLDLCGNYLQALIYNCQQRGSVDGKGKDSGKDSGVDKQLSNRQKHQSTVRKITAGKQLVQLQYFGQLKNPLTTTKMQLKLARYYFQYCAVRSQLQNNSHALQAAKKAIRMLRLPIFIQKQYFMKELLKSKFVKDEEQSQSLINSQSKKLHEEQQCYALLSGISQMSQYSDLQSKQKQILRSAQLSLKIWKSQSNHNSKEHSSKASEDQQETTKQRLKGLIIGKIMQIKPKVYDKQSNQSIQDGQESSCCILQIQKFILRIFLLSVGYFSVATELRLLAYFQYKKCESQRKQSYEYKQSKIYHLIAIIIFTAFIPYQCQYVIDMLISYSKHYGGDDLIIGQQQQQQEGVTKETFYYNNFRLIKEINRLMGYTKQVIEIDQNNNNNNNNDDDNENDNDNDCNDEKNNYQKQSQLQNQLQNQKENENIIFVQQPFSSEKIVVTVIKQNRIKNSIDQEKLYNTPVKNRIENDNVQKAEIFQALSTTKKKKKNIAEIAEHHNIYHQFDQPMLTSTTKINKNNNNNKLITINNNSSSKKSKKELKKSLSKQKINTMSQSKSQSKGSHHHELNSFDLEIQHKYKQLQKVLSAERLQQQKNIQSLQTLLKKSQQQPQQQEDKKIRKKKQIKLLKQSKSIKNLESLQEKNYAVKAIKATTTAINNSSTKYNTEDSPPLQAQQKPLPKAQGKDHQQQKHDLFMSTRHPNKTTKHKHQYDSLKYSPRPTPNLTASTKSVKTTSSAKRKVSSSSAKSLTSKSCKKARSPSSSNQNVQSPPTSKKIEFKSPFAKKGLKAKKTQKEILKSSKKCYDEKLLRNHYL